jgi:presenilin-like A22 family membrane protease
VQIAVARMALSIAGMFAGAAIAYYIVRVTTDAGFRLGLVAGALAGFLIGVIAFPIKKS